MSHHDQPAPASAWLTPVLAASAFIGLLGVLALGPFLPLMAADLDTSVALLGQVPALAMLVAAALGLVVGPLADHYGHRRALLVGLLTVVISALATGLATSYLILLLAVLIGSIGRAALAPVSQAIASSRFSGAVHRRAVSWIVSGASGAAIIGVPLMTTIAGLSDWRVAFLALAVVTLAIIGLMVWLMDADQGAPRARLDVPGILRGYRVIGRHRPTLGILAASLIASSGLWMMATYLGAFLVERHAFSIQEVGWVYLGVGVAVLAGSLLAGGRLGGRSPRPLLFGMRLLSGLLVAAAFLLPLPAWPAMALIITGMAANGVGTVLITLILSAEAPGGRATTLTLNGSLYSAGIALGSSLGGLLLVVGDYRALGAGILALLIGAAGLIWWSRPEPVIVPAPAVSPVIGD